jgi:hypothetical protein
VNIALFVLEGGGSGERRGSGGNGGSGESGGNIGSGGVKNCC